MSSRGNKKRRQQLRASKKAEDRKQSKLVAKFEQKPSKHTPKNPTLLERNDKCSCGSGKKYKKCCGFKQPKITKVDKPLSKINCSKKCR